MYVPTPHGRIEQQVNIIPIVHQVRTFPPLPIPHDPQAAVHAVGKSESELHP